nr:hypothetical protein Iba_chr09eCG14230 [Ipomoea batatas]
MIWSDVWRDPDLKPLNRNSQQPQSGPKPLKHHLGINKPVKLISQLRSDYMCIESIVTNGIPDTKAAYHKHPTTYD